MSHAGNVNFYSFAAEIQWHAVELQSENLGTDDYYSYLKADLGVEADPLKQQSEYVLFNGYLSNQRAIHGKK